MGRLQPEPAPRVEAGAEAGWDISSSACPVAESQGREGVGEKNVPQEIHPASPNHRKSLNCGTSLFIAAPGRRSSNFLLPRSNFLKVILRDLPGVPLRRPFWAATNPSLGRKAAA